MAKFSLNLTRWHPLRDERGIDLGMEVHLRPMGQLERYKVLGAMGDEVIVETTDEGVDDRRKPFVRRVVTRKPVTERMAFATKMALACVLGWRGVDDENGNPIPFNQENLESLCGNYPEIDAAIVGLILDLNGIGGHKRYCVDADEGDAADPRMAGGSQVSAIATSPS